MSFICYDKAIMKILIIDNAEHEDRKFNKPLIDTASSLVSCDVVNYKDIPSSERISSTYGGVILSGVPIEYSRNTIEDRHTFLDWVIDIQIPVLGICLGHQIVGTLFDASVMTNYEAEEGIRTVSVLRDDPILEGMPFCFEVRALHTCSITVPEDFLLLARSSGCVNEIMKHHEKDIYGFQFHPELLGGSIRLVENFISIAKSKAEQPELLASYM